MRSQTVAFLLFLGCGVEDESAASEPLHTADELTIDELSRVDVRGAAESISLVARQIAGLDPKDRRMVAESLRVLQRNDPYTRAAMQLPFVLHHVVAAIPEDKLDPLVHHDWSTLQRGLATHVALLEALEVDLPVPEAGDALVGEQEWQLDRNGLLTSADPMRTTSLLVGDIVSLAAHVPEEKAALIDQYSARVEQVTGIVRPCPRGPSTVLPGQPWTLGMQLGGWHNALRRVEPFITDSDARAEVAEMIAVLDAFGASSFVGR